MVTNTLWKSVWKWGRVNPRFHMVIPTWKRGAVERMRMRQSAVERETTAAAAKATATAMAVWWYGMFALCARENWLALAKA